jgi:hypothetical protein
MGSMSTLMAPVVNFTTGLKPMKQVLDKALGVSSHRDLPKYSQGTFRGWYKKQKTTQARFARQIAYFHGCYVNYNHPQLGKELVQVLNAMNIGVQLLAREKCCGVPLIANGFMDKARQQAAFNIQQLENTLLGNEMPLLATSSTGFTLRDEYPHLLEQDNHKVRDRISLVTRFLWNEFDRGNKPAMKPSICTSPTTPPATWRRWGRHLHPRAAAGHPRRQGDGAGLPVLRHRRHLRLQVGELRHQPGHRPGAVRSDKPAQARSGHHRLRDLQVADRDEHGVSLRTPGAPAGTGAGLTAIPRSAHHHGHRLGSDTPRSMPAPLWPALTGIGAARP